MSDFYEGCQSLLEGGFEKCEGFKVRARSRTCTRVKRPLFLSKRANNNTGICFVSLRCLLKTI